jgi:DNA-binding transcriptional ArsR family regulator
VVDVYKALADPTRRAILDALVETDGQTLFSLCTKVTARQEADLSRQAISQHLAILEEAGLLRTEKRGRFKLHFVDTTPLTEIGRRWPVTREET